MKKDVDRFDILGGSSPQTQILGFLENNKGSISTIALSIGTGLSTSKVREILLRLQKQGAVEKVGESRVSIWKFSGQPKSEMLKLKKEVKF